MGIRNDDRITWQRINRDLIDTGAEVVSATSQHGFIKHWAYTVSIREGEGEYVDDEDDDNADGDYNGDNV